MSALIADYGFRPVYDQPPPPPPVIEPVVKKQVDLILGKVTPEQRERA